MPLKHSIIMETGGMKGRRVEPSRDEVHQTLQNAFGLTKIHSEYGMTELLSQAYSQGNGRFHCPPSMRIIPRDLEAPRLHAALESRCGLEQQLDCEIRSRQDAGASQYCGYAGWHVDSDGGKRCGGYATCW
jgi:hypothetical protein